MELLDFSLHTPSRTFSGTTSLLSKTKAMTYILEKQEKAETREGGVPSRGNSEGLKGKSQPKLCHWVRVQCLDSHVNSMSGEAQLNQRPPCFSLIDDNPLKVCAAHHAKQSGSQMLYLLVLNGAPPPGQ